MPAYLVSYDITASVARTRIAALLEKQGTRIQKSVFLVRCSAEKLQHLEQNLLVHLTAEDSLLIIPVCESCFQVARIHCSPAPLLYYD